MSIAPSKRAGSAIAARCVMIVLMFLTGTGSVCPKKAAGADLPGPLPTGRPSAEILRQGERMYREGILPSGKPFNAIVKGDIAVTGISFTCVSCHQRSGIGSFEGGVYTPPTTGAYLFREQKGLFKGAIYKGAEQSKKYSRVPPLRPPYTDESLARVLRSGVDPTGRTLSDVMPRYLLRDNDMAILIDYLKSLSAHFSPGVTDTTIRFATVISDRVTLEKRAVFLKSLEKVIAYKNNQMKYYQTKIGGRSGRMAETMLISRETAYKNLSLSIWELRGPPETWRIQLEEYSRRDPVFALLSGITNGEWRPIHQFCEENRIPCLFPITDYPVISESAWYTLYFSKGLFLEGETAARYLNTTNTSLKNKGVLQIIRDSPESKALSEGFRQTWQSLGHKAPVTVTLKGEKLTEASLQKLLTKEKPAVLVIWDGSNSTTSLDHLDTSKHRPAMVIVSSTYTGNEIYALPEQIRDFVYITYPFRLPQDEVRYTDITESFMGTRPVSHQAQIIQKQIYAAYLVLSQALTEMNGEYYRDNLLDVIGMGMNSMMSSGMTMGAIGIVEPDSTFPLYERFSFGPGQRYASKGCYIVQLTHGPAPHLVKKSGWVIH